jgi:hypothetical protein
VYDCKEKRLLLNPKGIMVKTYLLNHDIVCSDPDGYEIMFNTNGQPLLWRNTNTRESDITGNINEYPEQVKRLYAIVTGENVNSMAESFKRMLKRIDEASKLSYNDIYK